MRTRYQRPSAALPSTKNTAKVRDPDMHKTKKGKTWRADAPGVELEEGHGAALRPSESLRMVERSPLNRHRSYIWLHRIKFAPQ